MSLHTKVAGVWQEVGATDFAVKVSGVWQEVQNGYIKVAGVWQQFYQNILVAFDNIFATASGPEGAAQASVRFNADGTIDVGEFVGGTGGYVSGGTWITPTSSASSAYEIRVTGLTGDAFDFSPGANGTWFNLGSNREWGIIDGNSALSVSKHSDFTISIRKDGVTLDSATVSLSANWRGG